MAGSGGHVPSRRPITFALRAAAIAFVLAGFTRALTVAIAAHTESAVIQSGGLASIGPTSRGFAALGVALTVVAGVLGYRWIQKLVVLSPAPLAADEPLPGGLHLVLPAGMSALDRRLSGTESRMLRTLVTVAWLAAIVALAVELSGVAASTIIGGEI